MAQPPKARHQATKPSPSPLPKELRHINLDAAGIDVGAESHFVAVPEGRDPAGCDVRKFGAFTADLHALADWLKRCHVGTIVMESTGVYWVPLFEVLDDHGFTVRLVNPRHIKNVPGRKTDVLDCQWLQQLHTYGLLRGSFRPENQICVLRSYLRQRGMLVAYASHHIQHMQKALDLMNLKLHHVVSDVTGVTGMAILRAILSGERNPQKLANLRDRRCKQDEATIAKALEGNWREEHLFSLEQAVQLFDFYHEQLLACDIRIEAQLRTFEDRSGDHPLPSQPRKRKRHRNEPSFDLKGHLNRVAGVDLTRIDGIDAHTALKVIGEIGLDMNRWATVKHFTSWLGVCPGNKISGGKVLSSKTKPSGNRAAAALRMAANGLHNSHSALGAFLRRKKAQIGRPQAVTATAHKLARLVYFMLKNGSEYVDAGQDYYELRYRDRTISNLRRRAQSLGYKLLENTELPSATIRV
jgi:transposase